MWRLPFLARLWNEGRIWAGALSSVPVWRGEDVSRRPLWLPAIVLHSGSDYRLGLSRFHRRRPPTSSPPFTGGGWARADPQLPVSRRRVYSPPSSSRRFAGGGWAGADPQLPVSRRRVYSPPSSSRRFAGEDGLARTLKSLFHGGMVCSLPRGRGRVRVGALSQRYLLHFITVRISSVDGSLGACSRGGRTAGGLAR
jgi:hypothetical protein